MIPEIALRLAVALERLADATEPACRTCRKPIEYIDCPTGGWWKHEYGAHPSDEHDAELA